MYRLIALLLLLLPFGTEARPANSTPELNLIPQPRHIELLSRRDVTPQQAEPEVRMDAPAEWNAERYTLTITPKRIEIRARGEQGVIWARRTLEQLRREDGSYPHVTINDEPEFPLRGFLYDDGRNFAGVERIKGYIDLMSAYKLNLFQWHLTDKPAWRIECRCHPRLNDGRFQRPGRDQGCYYTYDQIREVVAYARERGVQVLPEIDMPGHSDFFQTAFGFSMDSPRGRAVLEECLEEFFAEVPAELCPMIHIGSDEVRIGDPEGFMAWAQGVVRRAGRTVFAWDPGLPAEPNTIRQFWREGTVAPVEYPVGVPFVDSGMGYLNNYDPLLLPAKMFFHTPCGSGEASDDARGGIVCLWNDVRVADKSLTALHSGLAGGIMTFAERFWSGGETTDTWQGTLLPAPDSEPMRRFEAFQHRMADHKRRFLAEELSYWEPIHAPEWQVEIEADTLHRTFTAWGDVLDLDALCRLHGIPDRLAVRCTATRTLMADEECTRRFKIGFEAPARSNRCSDGIAPAGCWPNEGHIEVNGREVAPPAWQEPATYRYHYPTWARLEEELPYTNEQLYWMREPIAVALRKGANTVRISLRRHFSGQHFQLAFVACDE